MTKNMKKIIVLFSAFSLMLVFPASITLAKKPAGNLAGNTRLDWHLSADLMPVPPYGSGDIEGSDTASKLNFNQPNGDVEAALTGIMKGLEPETVYTVFLSNAYAPYEEKGWDISGDWVIRSILGGNYDHDYTIAMEEDGSFTGMGGYPAGGPYSITEEIKGAVNRETGEIVFYSEYDNGYWYEAEGVIAGDGSISGAWGNDSQGYGHDWSSISGEAKEVYAGNTGWPGYFTKTVPSFTFMTDEYGEGSWHLNLRDENFPETGEYEMSLWINAGGKTILISDIFAVSVKIE